MNDASTMLRSLLLWGLPIALVVVALGYETDWGQSVMHEAPPPATGGAQPVAVALLPEYTIDGGADARKETVDRTLFNPTRRPAPAAAQTAGGGSPMQHGIYTLTGTTVVGNAATAFLREVKGGKSRSVRQGDTLDGMLVAEVRADHVRLKQGDDVEDLQLKIAGGPKSTIQTVTAPPAPVPGQPAAQPAVAAAQAAGGSSAAGVPGRPVIPATAGTAVRPPSNVGELLAERRRAARAAAEAAAANPNAAQPAARR